LVSSCSDVWFLEVILIFVQVSVVIPAYNEELDIAKTINAVKNFPEVGEIIVIDDGSVDGTKKEAAAVDAYVYSNPYNLGKGASLNIGSIKAKGDVIVFLDGDLGDGAWEAVKLWRAVLQGEADCAIAKFPKSTGGGFGLTKALAKWGVNYFGGKKLETALSGQRAFSRAALETILPLGEGFGVEVKASIDLLKKGLKIKEIDVSMTHRRTDRNLKGFLHRGKQFGQILKLLASEALR